MPGMPGIIPGIIPGCPGIMPGAGGPSVEANDVQGIQQLAEPVRHLVLGAFTSALDDVFLVGVPFLVVAFLVALTLRELPLRTGQPQSQPQP